MNDLPPYVWPIVSLVCSAFGGWVGVKISVTKLETQMERVLTDVGRNTHQLSKHSEDLLTHDLELEQALDKLQLKRTRRQTLRGWDE